ncbi:septal ring lytic transglycosylase RlpA family protein [Spirulina subsalsa FACHB-351]|uniref:Probable endolytic peptidoglycan transglycosylase RlpA n=1 Tax=Spirulina subsalsa FACHB-351 TaxID=234711 RepID=A0ABT3L762_9CYAN|nr:septal ring lytic transglycosylase RlpA family protein [Spirulina subsalsa]MCW6037346.1 septal ring lytic transglycosylase RlpA family protein [Spirulina subsalsa FACHB-351]
MSIQSRILWGSALTIALGFGIGLYPTSAVIAEETGKDEKEIQVAVVGQPESPPKEEKVMTRSPHAPRSQNRVSSQRRTTSEAVAYRPAPATSHLYRGVASWYGPNFHGRRSASGEIYNQNAMTAAHRTLPFGTRVRVTNLNNGRSVVVRINDRGPFIAGRVIDLSRGAAQEIGLIRSGVAPVSVEVLGR